ncbi:hypothetical protein AHF37_09672 [Paragonimus kellicotti]|nr:hypothetical protein AHF37_09672 [Paragonimus kellicotti]
MSTADPIKRFIVSAEEGDLATLQEIVTRAQKNVPGAHHPSVVELLSAKDADGYSALHRAAYGGHVRTVEVSLNGMCPFYRERRKFELSL